jgi:hypothetical protein
MKKTLYPFAMLLVIALMFALFHKDYKPNYSGFQSGFVINGKEVDTEKISHLFKNQGGEYLFDLEARSKNAYIKCPQKSEPDKYKVLNHYTQALYDTDLKMNIWHLENDYENIYVVIDPINSKIFVSEDCFLFGKEACKEFKHGRMYKVKEL